ncbi:hypothetical protein CRUP_017581 [Coryphaenoides rupestris]|nr:hypothetical protein CRUP_017581 [Coryphaenoides rupestris]
MALMVSPGSVGGYRLYHFGRSQGGVGGKHATHAAGGGDTEPSQTTTTTTRRRRRTTTTGFLHGIGSLLPSLAMDEEEQFVNIDLNDDNICSVCKLETDTGTMSFCHSLRGHRDCFEKYHLIADQKPPRPRASSRGGGGAYEGVRLALGRKLSRLIQYAQNKEADRAKHLGYGGDRRGGETAPHFPPRRSSDAQQVPRYAPHWDVAGGGAGDGKEGGLPDYTTVGMLECHAAEELQLGLMIPPRRGAGLQAGGADGSDEQVFEELTAAVQEKDSLASELHVRHVAIEQLFKNCAKLPWLHISRAARQRLCYVVVKVIVFIWGTCQPRPHLEVVGFR